VTLRLRQRRRRDQAWSGQGGRFHAKALWRKKKSIAENHANKRESRLHSIREIRGETMVFFGSGARGGGLRHGAELTRNQAIFSARFLPAVVGGSGRPSRFNVSIHSSTIWQSSA
jgi:hypothetical protein